MQTLIRFPMKEQSDLGLHCLHMLFCQKKLLSEILEQPYDLASIKLKKKTASGLDLKTVSFALFWTQSEFEENDSALKLNVHIDARKWQIQASIFFYYYLSGVFFLWVGGGGFVSFFFFLCSILNILALKDL